MSPVPIDGYPTDTSSLQAETERILEPYDPSNDRNAILLLQRNAHLQFLMRHLLQGFPGRYTSQDASQPWLLFWTVQGFSLLGVALGAEHKNRAIETILRWQHPKGGFGGGPGQAAHLLSTYAAVCALANVGRPGPGGGWDAIDRGKMYEFFMALKQPDGSFLVAHDGEVDVRGIYCLLATAVLLDIYTPALIKGTAAFLASCQTYEGGFASSSQPYFSPPTSPSQEPTLLSSPRPPLGESHGGYTFCALAAWTILSHHTSTEKEQARIDERALLRWLALMQGGPSDLGGFRGRTNKLVDGCYSWWVGGAFALFNALRGRVSEGETSGDALLDREALQTYVLLAGQHPAGGLRDKPPKGPDAYHTLYCLSGLAAAQHRVYPSRTRREAILKAYVSDPERNDDELRKAVFADSLAWTEDERGSTYVGGSVNRVNAVHPLFNLTVTHSEAIMAHFYKQTVPKGAV